MVNKLEVEEVPDKAHLKIQSNIIKKDDTVENSISYELSDEVNLVIFIAKQGSSWNEIGRHDYKLD